MIDIQENIKLATLTTFGTGGIARYFVAVHKEEELVDALDFAKEKNLEILILAGGSNTIFSDDSFSGLVIHINFKGIELEDKDKTKLLHVAAGEVWDDIVKFAVENNLWGIENLSSIPGSAGAVAVQNIGAYGVEASEVILSVRVYDRETGEIKDLDVVECEFKYRSSIFNTTARGHYIILQITLQLSIEPNLRIDYPDVIKYFSEKNITEPTLAEIREAIVIIRASKFTDTSAGTAGSFFKNLYLSEDEYNKMHEIITNKKPELVEELEEIKNKFPNNDGIKISTAWVIDKVCGLKGKKIGGAQVSDTAALAILNPDKKATSEDIKNLIDLVIDSVYEYTGQRLQVEPELVGFGK